MCRAPAPGDEDSVYSVTLGWEQSYSVYGILVTSNFNPLTLTHVSVKDPVTLQWSVAEYVCGVALCFCVVFLKDCFA